ncbi:MAG: hypothetical protein M0R21_03065 [Lentimicrobiaceae bacterium]|nr:hypothetical protein [Lentimicrobiaceae bacterium]
MNIHRGNYEIYFLDYLEGRLSPKEVERLLFFMEDNPGLKAELEGLDTITLYPDETAHFTTKDALKKNVISSVDAINENNYEEFFIASLEGEKTPAEQKNLKLFIEKNPGLKKEYDLLAQTFLIPDTNLVYDRKQQLKKFVILSLSQRQLYRATAFAASLLLLAGLFFLLNREKPLVTTQYSLAEMKQKSEVKSSASAQQKKTPATKIRKIPRKVIINRTSLSEVLPALSSQGNDENAAAIQRTESAPLQTMPALTARELNNNMPLNPFNYDFGYRNYYTAVFYDLQLVAAIQFNQSLAAEQKKARTPIEYARMGLKNLFSSRDAEDVSGEYKVSFWDVAHVGLKGFNAVTGSNFDLKKQQDTESGTIVTGFTGNEIGIYNTRQR